MQFGQLLTHLDTTQQMIASSLKDNTTLLTQVCPVIGLLPPFFRHTDQILQLYLSVFCLSPFDGIVCSRGLVCIFILLFSGCGNLLSL